MRTNAFTFVKAWIDKQIENIKKYTQKALIQKEVKRSVLGRFCVDFVTFEDVCENMLLIFSKKDAIMW